MISLSVQNIIPFLVPYLLPFKIEEYQIKQGVITEQDSVGPSQETPLPPISSVCFLFVEELYSLKLSLIAKEHI